MTRERIARRAVNEANCAGASVDQCVNVYADVLAGMDPEEALARISLASRVAAGQNENGPERCLPHRPEPEHNGCEEPPCL